MNKETPSLIQVLWVEDDPDVTMTYPLEAADYGLQLVPFPCWDDAEVALKSEFDRWSAIILDAKCKQHRDSVDNAKRFLMNALLTIKGICNERKRVIPWYVLSGGAESEISDLIADERKDWDADWPKYYYEKATDREMLYRRIRIHARKSAALQVHELYKDVFGAIESLDLPDNVYNLLEDLLVPIHFLQTSTEKEYNNMFKNARIIVENVFRSMMEHGILPQRNYASIQWNSKLLSGTDVMKNDKLVVKSNGRIVPKILGDNIKSIIYIANSAVHPDENDEERLNTPEYLQTVGGTSYLLKSHALQLCDFILWYRNYLEKHPNKDENCKGWTIVDEDTFFAK